MSAAWQFAVVVVVVLSAAAFLGQRIWLRLTKAARDSGCGSCSQNPAVGNPVGDMVSLDALTLTAEKASTPPAKH
jgi:hypothetical protein